jgi:hypothetical protein
MRRENIYFKYPVSANGSFSFSTPLCGGTSDVMFIAEDAGTGLQGSAINHTLVNSNNALGTINVCGVATGEFFTYAYNGATYTYSIPADTMRIQAGPSNTITVSGNHGVYSYAGLTFSSVGIGLNTNQPINFFYKYDDPIYMGVSPSTIQITEYGQVGEYIAGNGTFMVESSPNPPFSLTVSFRVRRTF